MLLIQNDKAAADLTIGMGLLVRGSDRDVRIYEKASRVCPEMLEDGVPETGLPPDVVERALTINRELRRVFEVATLKPAGEFDQNYSPIGGWKLYFKHNAHDLSFRQKLELDESNDS